MEIHTAAGGTPADCGTFSEWSDPRVVQAHAWEVGFQEKLKSKNKK